MGFLDSVKNALKGVITAPAPTAPSEPVPAASGSAAHVAPEVAPEAAPTYTTYTIRTGDTLGEIGARHGVAREELARINGIDEPDLIFPGQELRIPTS